jgi:CHASE2 domain-containing sensor protein
MSQLRLKLFWQNSREVIAIAVGVTILVSAARLLGWLQPLELAALDRLFQTRPLERSDSRIVIVGITEEDIRQYQQYPFTDAFLAQLLRKVKGQNPRVIGLDLVRDILVAPGSDDLTNIFQTTPNLIGAGTIESASVPGDQFFTSVGFPRVLYQLEQVGDVGLFVDDDLIVRRGILYPLRDGFSTIPSFALKIAYKYLEKENIQPSGSKDGGWLQLNKTVFYPFSGNDGGYVRANDTGYQILINWRGPAESFKHVSVAQVMDNQIAPDLLTDRIVLIGAYAPTLNRDAQYTPFSRGKGQTPKPTYGVEIQANLTSQILSTVLDNRPPLKTWADLGDYIWLLVWVGAASLWGWKLRHLDHPIILLSLVGLGGAVGTATILLITYRAFLWGWWFPSVSALIGIWGALIVGIIYSLTWQKLLQKQKSIEQLKIDLSSNKQKLDVAQAKLIAAERLTFLGRLIAGFNHEIGNLFSSIATNTEGSKVLVSDLRELILEDSLSTEEITEEQEEIIRLLEKNLEIIELLTQRGTRLGQELLPLDFDNSLRPKTCSVEINQLVKDCFHWVVISKTGDSLTETIQLEENYDSSLNTIEAVPAELNFVVSNLINNAWDALLEKQQQSDAGYVPTIRLITQKKSERIQIIIQDNGIGVSDRIEEEIFQLFFTTKSSERGTGLGLSLARDIIVARYQGNIRYQTINSETGKETQFIVELPKM